MFRFLRKSKGGLSAPKLACDEREAAHRQAVLEVLEGMRASLHRIEGHVAGVAQNTHEANGRLRNLEAKR
jgi:hypothetical protein